MPMLGVMFQADPEKAAASLAGVFLELLLQKDCYLRYDTCMLACSVSDPDPDSITSVDADPDLGSGSRRPKMTQKN
jgi:hypothetical protein